MRGRSTLRSAERRFHDRTAIDVLHGETAITHYKRLAYQDGLSLISLKLETGRTHQIRVHMKSIGHH